LHLVSPTPAERSEGQTAPGPPPTSATGEAGAARD
jgi:hypothetical protein